MTDLILLTAISRPKNVDKMIRNIKEMTEMFFDKVRMKWVVCLDVYNTNDEDGKIILQKLNESGLDFALYDSGKPNQKNFGGDMYNIPLHDTYNRYYKEQGIDPWIYILDDDNYIIRPGIDQLVYVDTNLKEFSLIASNYFLTDPGNMGIFGKNNFLVIGACNYAINNPDPSAVFFKYSVFDEFGDFNGGVDYDFTSVRVMFFNNMHRTFLTGNHSSQICCLHNGIKDKTDLEWLEYEQDKCELFVKLQDNDLMSRLENGFYVKDKDRVRRIVEILKEECQD